MIPRIAIVGMACRYPDARTPGELWENVLAQRRAFRRLPPERLRLADYFSADRAAPDATYSTEAALIADYEFDRVAFRIAGPTFRATDPAHWLALDVAAQALADAGFPDGKDLPRERTGVVVGNTLTGEFSRAQLMRLRWPYVRRVVAAVMGDAGRDREETAAFLAALEAAFKKPFPPVGEESLAGGLANTIAGRICNHFDLQGGGYTVDGACASSLLALIQACSALAAGDLDVAVAGGVDLSLDPFELVGFAKTDALAADEMRVYDARAAGFWPGEGCGMVVLMRHQDAVAERQPVDVIVRGWGVSSDGSGGITRPEPGGQILALRRAYQRAGCGIETVTSFEGHGTGTEVGDATELGVLSRLRREAPVAPAAVIGSIKANIGHTKAAAGVAGVIKSAMAIRERVLPPHTGSDEPHPELAGDPPVLRLLRRPEPWPADRSLRAGVSAMGFGGINTHLVLEGVGETDDPRTFDPPSIPRPRLARFAATPQDAELVLLAGEDEAELRRQVEPLRAVASGLSRAELTDLAAAAADRLADQAVRAAIVAVTPKALASGLRTLDDWLTKGETERLDAAAGVFLGRGATAPRIGFLFSGQGSRVDLDGGLWRRRFAAVGDLYRQAELAPAQGTIATEVAQPAVVTASLAGLEVLAALGVEAGVAVGHSLGEITALHWAGVLEAGELLTIARARGETMARWGSPGGAMAALRTGPDAAAELVAGTDAVVAGLNSPRQTVVSGPRPAVATVMAKARRQGIGAAEVSVSHAFHSPLMAAVGPHLAEVLAEVPFRPFRRVMISTVTGAPLTPDDDPRELLVHQVTSPVRFQAAVAAAGSVDLWLEVGPGELLRELTAEIDGRPVIALDAGGSSLRGLLQAAGAAFALGAPIVHRTLFDGRFTRRFDFDHRPSFFVNPCELAPVVDVDGEAPSPASRWPQDEGPEAPPPVAGEVAEPLELVRGLVARQAELPSWEIKESHRLLGDLHLNSITVSQLVTEAARHLGLAPPTAPTDFARATVSDLARALDQLRRTGALAGDQDEDRQPAGVDSWVRAFRLALVETPRPRPRPAAEAGSWRLLGPPDHPLREPLEKIFRVEGRGDGVLLCLPPEPGEGAVDLLLEAAHAVLNGRPSSFVLVQHGGGGGGFARTLHLEAAGVVTCVVDVPPDEPRAAEWVLAESLAVAGFTEVRYDSSGVRREPVLELVADLPDDGRLPLAGGDVLLVTGGGKGIAAECALALARETGAALALLGRSAPAADAELRTNLERIAAAGVRCRYLRADVTDPEAVAAAVRRTQGELGPVTALLHGAGVNVPALLTELDAAAFRRTLAPKVRGFDHLIAAVDPAQLRCVVTFGSIIARTGMRGEADYAVANEWLARRVEAFQAAHPACRCRNVEWSVWSGVGMGERLGRVEALRREGITPIAPDEGIAILRRLLTAELKAPSVVVSGRLGEVPTLRRERRERRELPLLRFLERPRVHYPGIELVADAELGSDTDPYLADHVFAGRRLLPAVIGLEAMAQVATALTDAGELPVFEDLELSRPVVVPESETVTLRVAALLRAPGCVDLVVRSGETRFQADHFRARCRFGAERPPAPDRALPTAVATVPPAPATDLYGDLFFQRGRFQRLAGYRALRARACVAEIGPGDDGVWFSGFLPQPLLLADPGARDAALHAIQASIPHATVLPVGVDRLLTFAADGGRASYVAGCELRHEGDLFVWDLELRDGDERVVERWEGLRLRALERTVRSSAWPLPLLGPYVERRVAELVPGAEVGVVLAASAQNDRRQRSDQALGQLLGPEVAIHRRPDGKPVVNGGVEVSVAHAGDLVLAVAGAAPLGCDLEPVAQRSPAGWRDLVGVDDLALAEEIARQSGEDLDAAATRVWTARESLKKAGCGPDAPLLLRSHEPDGWCLLGSGRLVVAALVAVVRGPAGRLAVAVEIPDASL